MTARDDDQLLDVLGDALAAADPVPDAILEMAKGALAWRRVDAELAAITSDSATEAPTGVRSGTATRTVLFTAGEVEIELTVEAATTTATGTVRLTLTGQVLPEEPGATVTVRHREGETGLETDAFGAFTAERIPAGPVSLVVDLGAGPVATETVTL